MNWRLSKLMVVVVSTFVPLVMFLSWPGGVTSARPTDILRNSSPSQADIPRRGAGEAFPIVTDAGGQHWVGISGDCIAYRGDNGEVYLHNLTSNETITITDKPNDVRKVVISQGIVVWRSERVEAGGHGLWGYYNPHCSDAGVFGDEVIDPFYIITRPNSIAPSLSGEMLTFDTRYPWQIHLIELDSNNNNLPDAIEDWYDPADDTFPIQLSCCQGGPHGQFFQRLSDIYWDDDYKIACWSVTSTFDLPPKLTCNDLHHYQEPKPFEYQFQVNNDTNVTPYDFGGIIAVHRDLVVWTGAREFDVSGRDLYITDLDLDDDGALNHVDPTPGPGPATFVLVNFSGHQEYPDIWGVETSPGVWRQFVVWVDRRRDRRGEIYAYDLSLDSDGDGLPNWRDPSRNCMDQAEVPVVIHPGAQSGPEIFNGRVVWIDQRSETPGIYGADLTPVSYQPLAGTPEAKARHWIRHMTVDFPQVNQIPGYVKATGMITRYKSFKRTGDDAEHVIQAWYPATAGAYGVSFDYCNFGTAEQKRYLGRFGRGFIYDQALMLIAHSMALQRAEAEDIAGFVSSFQNTDQLQPEFSGCFGFSFNGQGDRHEKDNFYDLNYIRFGANGWIGYGYLFFARRFDDPQFMEVVTRVGDCILRHQIMDRQDPRYGLFTGGFGGWPSNFPDIFIEEDIDWVSAEHNIDIYFFLRDLGRLTGQPRYLEAANLLKSKMINLWNPDKGCLNQGMEPDGTPDTFDALDACTWGAMFWLAIGDIDKAKSSLDYADAVFRNTVTVSDTIHAGPVITIQGYKPYGNSPDMVWSEGSLGAAMAYVKLAAALKKLGDPHGDVYRQQAVDIASEMAKLQELDPNGGLFYAAYPDEEVTDFPRAPSMAGATWLVMVLEALENEAMRDAFWGPEYSSFVPLITKN